MNTIPRDILEKVALEKAPAFLVYDLLDNMDSTSDNVLKAIISGNHYITEDKIIIYKSDNQWINLETNEVAFTDADGMPYDEEIDDIVSGRFILKTEIN